MIRLVKIFINKNFLCSLRVVICILLQGGGSKNQSEADISEECAFSEVAASANERSSAGNGTLPDAKSSTESDGVMWFEES